MATLQFNAATVPPSQPFEVIPAAWYMGQLIASEMKPNSKGDGYYLATEMEILGGEYAGRKLFDRLNISNPNPKAVEIAYRTLSAICHAIGVIQVEDSQQLHGKPLMIKVKVTPAETDPVTGKTYEPKNEVTGYKAVEQSAQQQQPPAWATTPAQTTTMIPPQQPAGTPPWMQQAQQPAAVPAWGQPQQQAQAAIQHPPVTPPWMQTQQAPAMTPATQPQAAPVNPAAVPPWMQQQAQGQAAGVGAAVPPWAVKK